MLKMKELPELERPYEKLELYGEETLSNTELLAIIIKTGTKNETALSIAQNVFNLGEKEDGFRILQEISIQELKQVKGIGRVKAIELKALGEITKRMSRPINNKKIQIKSASDVAKLLMEEMKFEKREIVKLILLNTKNIVLKIKNISLGGSNFAVIDPKDILVEAIKMQAPKIILVHNHPSGNPTPSNEDYCVTKRVYKSAEIIGIELLDHIIIGDGKYESILFKQNG